MCWSFVFFLSSSFLSSSSPLHSFIFIFVPFSTPCSIFFCFSLGLHRSGLRELKFLQELEHENIIKVWYECIPFHSCSPHYYAQFIFSSKIARTQCLSRLPAHYTHRLSLLSSSVSLSLSLTLIHLSVSLAVWCIFIAVQRQSCLWILPNRPGGNGHPWNPFWLHLFFFSTLIFHIIAYFPWYRKLFATQAVYWVEARWRAFFSCLYRAWTISMNAGLSIGLVLML